MWYMCLVLPTVVGGGVATFLFVLFHAFKLPRFPPDVAKAFVEKSRRGPIAHRGGKPENTLAAFRYSKDHGASGVEMDVQLTKDGHPVIIHDSTVERTSNGSGKVQEMTLEEIRKLDFGIKHGEEFAGECIPTLCEAIDVCQELELLVYLDIKGDAGNLKKCVNAVKELFAERPHLYDQVAVVSFWPHVLYKIRCADPNIICGLTQRRGVIITHPDGRPREPTWWKHFFFHRPFDLLFWSVDTWLWRLLGVSMLTPCKKDILSGELDVKKWERRGVHLVTWTVNKEEEKSYFRDELKIPFITDNVDPTSTAPEQNT